MNCESIIDTVLENLKPVFVAANELINEFYEANPKEKLQFPILMEKMAFKMNWDEQETRENDPIVRAFVRKSGDWVLVRGAHGGIMRASDKKKKAENKAQINEAKLELEKLINDKTSQ